MSARTVKKPAADAKTQSSTEPSSMKETVRTLRVQSNLKAGAKAAKATLQLRGG